MVCILLYVLALCCFTTNQEDRHYSLPSIVPLPSIVLEPIYVMTFKFACISMENYAYHLVMLTKRLTKLVACVCIAQ